MFSGPPASEKIVVFLGAEQWSLIGEHHDHLQVRLIAQEAGIGRRKRAFPFESKLSAPRAWSIDANCCSKPQPLSPSRRYTGRLSQ